MDITAIAWPTEGEDATCTLETLGASRWYLSACLCDWALETSPKAPRIPWATWAGVAALVSAHTCAIRGLWDSWCSLLSLPQPPLHSPNPTSRALDVGGPAWGAFPQPLGFSRSSGGGGGSSACAAVTPYLSVLATGGGRPARPRCWTCGGLALALSPPLLGWLLLQVWPPRSS